MSRASASGLAPEVLHRNVVFQFTNEVMKRFTLVVTIFIPLTFVVGVYGMSCSDHATNLPELSWSYAYPR